MEKSNKRPLMICVAGMLHYSALTSAVIALAKAEERHAHILAMEDVTPLPDLSKIKKAFDNRPTMTLKAHPLPLYETIGRCEKSGREKRRERRKKKKGYKHACNPIGPGITPQP